MNEQDNDNDGDKNNINDILNPSYNDKNGSGDGNKSFMYLDNNTGYDPDGIPLNASTNVVLDMLIITQFLAHV